MHFCLYTIETIDIDTTNDCIKSCTKGKQLQCEVNGIKFLSEHCDKFINNDVETVLDKYHCENNDFLEFEEQYTEEDAKKEFEKTNKENKEKYDNDLDSFMEEQYGVQKNQDTGTYGNFYNPYSKYDWYSIGGRWGGSIPTKDGKQVDTAYGVNIDKDKFSIPYAFLNIDTDEWEDQDNFLRGNWEEYAKNLIKNIKDNQLVTVVDYHF